ncbi:hypothetical protein [Mycolicibacterium setense]|uniref:hypothetical protein n=1 Tax=Mycolicibacterium setense TaxID=431269 RepID=UPI00147007B1|nr:hypothetical protein [Mycolicibacterium setense]MCV7110589.1 hypothetical protein [Mycolicibacterium setense]
MLAGDRLLGIDLHADIGINTATDDDVFAGPEGEHCLAEPNHKRWRRRCGHDVLLFGSLPCAVINHAHGSEDALMVRANCSVA